MRLSRSRGRSLIRAGRDKATSALPGWPNLRGSGSMAARPAAIGDVAMKQTSACSARYGGEQCRKSRKRADYEDACVDAALPAHARRDIEVSGALGCRSASQRALFGDGATAGDLSCRQTPQH